MGKRLNLYEFRDNGEDDGYRIYTDEGYVLCNRCQTRMDFREDMDERISYYICPKCKFIEIDEYYDDDDYEDDYELYWPEDDDEDE